MSIKILSRGVRRSTLVLLACWTLNALSSFASGQQTTVDASAMIENQTLALWPAGLPADAKPLSPKAIEKAKNKTTDLRIAYVDAPSLSVFPAPTSKGKTPAVIICPGGGYQILAWIKEGTKIAEWFNSIGISAFVLKYRVPRRDPNNIHHEPLQDVQRAIRLLRSQAQQYGIDPNQIGVLGFSAGGHLSVMAGTQFDQPSYPAVDEADKLSCRPDFMCPIYAAYLGEDYKDDVVELGELVQVSEKTPPTFLAVTADDKKRGAQSALLFAKLCESGVKAELHVWQKGGHGYGMEKRGKPCDGWEEDLRRWLELNGVIAEEADREKSKD